MKLLLALLAFAFAHVSCAQNQTGTDILQLAIQELPPCALKCTLSKVGASTCELTDIACIKGNKALLDDLSVCVKSSCTVKEALTAKRFLQTLIGAPVRSKKELGTLTTLIVGGIAVLFWLLRLIARLPMFGGNWGLDDWVMAAAMILIIPLTICAYLLNQLGMGTDMWLVPFGNITKILEIFYFTELLYLASIAMTKISILLFYLRIFPQRELRKAIWFTIVLCVLYIISFVVATALQCIPIRNAWERWDGEHHGKCIDLNAHAWCSAAINIVLDLVVIILPIREVKKLVISRRHKFGVMIMFLGGLFVTVVSMLRLKYLVQLAQSDNVTWDYLPIGYWSAVESHVGVMVACLPAMRSLQISLQRKLSRPANTPNYYEKRSKGSSNKAIRKCSNSLEFSSMGRSLVDKEDFVPLNKFETNRDVETQGEESCPRSSSLERALTYLSKPIEDFLPLADSGAPTGQPLGGIWVESEYTVDTTSEPRETSGMESDQELAYRLGGRI